MDDELKEKIIIEFNKLFDSDDTIRSLYRSVSKGTATEATSYKFAKRCSELTNYVFKAFVKPKITDENLYYDLAEQTIIPMLKKDYDVISKYCINVSKLTLEKLELGLNPIKPQMDTERAEGLVKAVSNYEVFNEDGLNQKIANYNYHIVDEHIKQNSRFMANSGIDTRVTRTTKGKTCEWCKNLAGTYDVTYDMPREVFMRHDNCDCEIEVSYAKHKRPSYYMKQSGHAFVRIT